MGTPTSSTPTSLLGKIAQIPGAVGQALNQGFAQDGGIQDVLSALMQDSPGAQGAANMGRALQQAQNQALNRAQARQRLAAGQIALQEQAAQLPLVLAYYGGYANQVANGNGNAPNASSAPNGAAPTSGQPQPNVAPGAPGGSLMQRIAAMRARMRASGVTPVGGSATGMAPVGGPAPNAAPMGSLPGGARPGVSVLASSTLSPYTIPTPASIAAMPVGGFSPRLLRLGAFLNHQNPLQMAQGIRAQQLAAARLQYGSTLGQLDTLTKSQSPAQYVAANPQLMQQWQQLAPSLGMDPTKGFTDGNVRTAFSFLRNRIAGALGEGATAPPVQMSTIRGPLGSIYSRNPITNALSQVKPEESLKPVLGPGGTITYVPASGAAGRPVFNAETYVDPATTAGVARLIANYDMEPLNGYALRTPQGQAVMAAVKQINPKYDATQYETKSEARIKFAVGPQGNAVRSLSVATSHFNMLSDAAHALSQSDVPAFNRVVNAFGAHVTGADPQTNFDAMKEIVGDEVVKAIVGTGGAESDREAIKDAFDAARSPRQIEGVITKYEALMGGQLRGLRRQYQKATGLDDFNSFVSTIAQQQLNSAASSALGTGTNSSLPGGPVKPLGIGQSASMGQFTVTRVR